MFFHAYKGIMRHPIKFSSLIFCAAFATLPSMADEIKGPISADVIRVIDGDTIEVNAHVWVGQYVRTKVRLRNVDTPETFRPKCDAERVIGEEAKDFVQANIGQRVSLRNIKMGSFGGRVIAQLETENGTDIGTSLMRKALAVPYNSDKPWCTLAALADASSHKG